MKEQGIYVSMCLACWSGTTLVTVLVDNQQPAQHITRSQTHTAYIIRQLQWRKESHVWWGKPAVTLSVLSDCSVIHAVS